MLLVLLHALAVSAFPAASAGAAVPQNNDRVNLINKNTLRAAVRKVDGSVANALEIHRNGGFRGFQPAPGCSLAGNEPVHDFLVQDIALDADGRPDTARTPLDTGVARTRNFQPGDTLPYVMLNHPLAGENPRLPGRRHRRYAVPYPDGHGTDAAGAAHAYPIVAGIRDMTPAAASAEYHTLGVRDLVSLVGVFPDYACYMGARIPRKEGYAVSVGAGYANPAVRGMARLAHPLFPNPVPAAQGSRWSASVLQKTIAIGEDDAAFKKFPGHKAGSLAVQFVIGKRLMHAYGPAGRRTRPLDTVIGALGYNNVNPRGTAPILDNPSTQVEIIYCTRELGYATRWEMWDTPGPKNPEAEVLAKARKACAAGHLGPPASFEGRYTEHFEIGPLVEDGTLGVYKYDQTLTDPATGRKETKTWYLVGGHDYTNLQPLSPPLDPLQPFAHTNLSPYYLEFYGIAAEPGGKLGAEPGTEPGGKPGAKPGAKPGGNPGAAKPAADKLAADKPDDDKPDDDAKSAGGGIGAAGALSASRR